MARHERPYRWLLGLLADCPAPDLLVVPGGPGIRKETNIEAPVVWPLKVEVRGKSRILKVTA